MNRLTPFGLLLVVAAHGCVSAEDFSPSCGDGRVDQGEQCDDGNNSDGDGCSADCLSDETCGNGVVDDFLGETCDDGNLVDGDGCQSDCTLSTCGDGVIDSGERCDDGAENGTGDGKCVTDCSIVQNCGDGELQGTETCDDGPSNGNGEGFCVSDCSVVQTCGDGEIQGTETCDDGASNSPSLIGACGSNNCTINTCGTNCYGSTGCPTAAGICVRFTCTTQTASQTACESCFGGNWQSITRDQWLNQGYCADVGGKYFDTYGAVTQCGGDATQNCCTNQGSTCAGSDNAWHFYDTAAMSNYYLGPSLGSGPGSSCTNWNNASATGTSARLTACERQY